jgi:hypothetical protein
LLPAFISESCAKFPAEVCEKERYVLLFSENTNVLLFLEIKTYFSQPCS